MQREELGLSFEPRGRTSIPQEPLSWAGRAGRLLSSRERTELQVSATQHVATRQQGQGSGGMHRIGRESDGRCRGEGTGTQRGGFQQPLPSWLLDVHRSLEDFSASVGTESAQKMKAGCEGQRAVRKGKPELENELDGVCRG